MPISFHIQLPDFDVPHPALLKHWLKMVIIFEGGKEGILNYIFCSDDELLRINKEHLKHDYYTDIITFDASAETLKRLAPNKKIIAGDMYISIDRVKDNAEKYKLTFEQELYKVMVHGLLHLLGYNDKIKSEIKEIRAKEEHYLKMVNW